MRTNVCPQLAWKSPPSAPGCARCEALQAELDRLRADAGRGAAEFAAAQARIAELVAELARAEAKLGHARSKGVALRAELKRGTAAAAALRAQLDRSNTAGAALRAELERSAATAAEAQKRVAELERRAKLNSENSSKPPASDGLAKPERKSRTASLRDETEKKESGGQPGHAGTTLRQVANPDRTVKHFPPKCDGCGAALEPSEAGGYVARQVFDLPEPRPLEVTEHRAYVCQCGCGRATGAAFPEGVGAPAQYGERLRAVATYLNVNQLVPEDRTAEILSDLFGVRISAATVADAVARRAGALESFMENVVLKEALAVPVKHMDETGFRVNKDLRWLHVVCTPWLTHYRIGGRGDMLSSVSGVIVHDFYKSYYGLAGVEHALCGSHLLRELRALIDIENEPWAAQMRVLLLRACHATNLVRARLDRLAVTDGMTEAEKLAVKQARAAVMRKLASITDLTERRHRAIVAGAIAYHEDLPAFGKPKLRKDGTPSKRSVAKRIGHNLAIRLRDYRTDVLRFVHDLSVPFTNNAAERAIRMAKVKMKISGCFRSLAGAQRFATVRGFIDTARKRGWNILAALSLSPEALIERWFSAA